MQAEFIYSTETHIKSDTLFSVLKNLKGALLFGDSPKICSSLPVRLIHTFSVPY
jgi:hypothetical protein